ncbi:MAG: hypothetical protein SPJ17_07225 [Anaeroplasma sp.]|uniref:hypothetical protein n=1 Tax=Anaeroplasma sp. TaxID=1872523 RepID=UPI002A91B38C|nr:hypothetical protein [Anaeroplasma sp.]MDY5983473.1 hypothetical protein [Anaeroplasma sp.]
MKNKLYAILGLLTVFFTCSCTSVFANNNTNDTNDTNVSDVYEEYVTTDMKVSFKYTEFGYDQVEIDENGKTKSFNFVVMGGAYLYCLDSKYIFMNCPVQFADGDTVRLTYKKDYVFKNHLIPEDFVKIERIDTASITKVEDDLIIRDDNGTIKDINVDYKKENRIAYESISNCVKFEDYSYSGDIYMSVSSDSKGEAHCIFYSFHPHQS